MGSTIKVGLELAEYRLEAEIARGGDAMVERARKAMEDPKAKTYALKDVKVEAPIRRPGRVLAVGLNYIDHCKEAGLPVPPEPVWSAIALAMVWMLEQATHSGGCGFCSGLGTEVEVGNCQNSPSCA